MVITRILEKVSGSPMPSPTPPPSQVVSPLAPPQPPESVNAYDMFRDGPLRYLGYANEVGEAFRYRFPMLVRPSYAVAMLYVAADTADKTAKVMEKGGDTAQSAMRTAFDTMLWQTLASVAVPGLTIFGVVRSVSATVGIGMSRGFIGGAGGTRGVFTAGLFKWAPTAAGLAVIPFIIHPIDDLVHLFMDSTTRPFLGLPPHDAQSPPPPPSIHPV